MTSQLSNFAFTRTPAPRVNPLAEHEEVWKSMLRLRSAVAPVDRARIDREESAAYESAISLAAALFRKAGVRHPGARPAVAVNELFCQLRPHAAKGYDPGRPFHRYLAGALHYVVLGMCRQDRRAAGLPTDDDPAAAGGDPARLAELLELRGLVARLPAGLRDVVLLRYFAGRTSREAAARLAISCNAVELRHRRAVARLRAALA